MDKNKACHKPSISNNNNNKNITRNISLIITEEEKKLYFKEGNSYIDYFMEIGINPSLLFKEEIFQISSINALNEILIPDIISKFPNYDKNSVVIDNKVIQMIFPKGFKCIEAKANPDPEFYFIILDNQLNSLEYLHKYISCLIIYENFSNYISLYSKYRANKTIDKSILGIYKKYYIPKCLAIVSLFPYIDKYEEILRNIYEIFLSKKINNLFLEELIMKLVIEIPKIPKGLKRVILKFPNKSIELTENKMNELPSIHCNYSHAIGHFNLEELIDIYNYLLLETKMIFFSSKIQELSNTIMSFLDLLLPLNYQYQVVSVLPKEFYSFCKSLVPFIFGINESYYRNYFKDNNIVFEDSTICVVDIDSGKYFMIAPGGELDEKDYPPMPKNLREKLKNKIEKYYQQLKNNSSKKNNIKEDNKQYQKIFYNFMINLFKDYPKYLMKDYGVRKTIKMHISYLIDLEDFIKSRDSSERDFYRKILNSQMFIELIYKRMMPKNAKEKIEALFFEEKIIEKKAKKKNFFGLSNINEGNILLLSKEYDYDKKISEIIDLTKMSKNSKEIILYINENINKNINIFKKDCLTKGFYIEKNNNDNKLVFNYYLFPLFINEKIFKINKNNFLPGKTLYTNIEKINAKIVNKIHLKLQNKKNIKNSEIENDIYLSYIIIWSLTFWYADKEERIFRFYQMIEVLDIIEEHEIEIFEILFENVVKYGTEENIRFLYKKFIERKLNPSWRIFSLVSKYLKSNHKLNKMSKSSTNIFIFNTFKEKHTLTKSSSNRNLKNENKEYLKKIKLALFRLRTLKNVDLDKNIFSDDVEFVAYSECPNCKNIINLAKLCSNLSSTKFITDEKTGVDKIKCPNKIKENKFCENYNEQKLTFQFGVELFNQDIENESTCAYLFVPLLSPTTIKKRLFSIANLCKTNNFDVELFKKKYTNIFWNCLWYFKLHDIEISFMLPYAENTKNYNINNSLNLRSYTDINNYNQNIKIVNEIKEIVNLDGLKNLDINKNFINNYKKEDLVKQIIFQFSIIKDKGFINKSNINLYNYNIGYNEIPLIDDNIKDNNSKNKDTKKGLRGSFWFSYVNRIISKTSENRSIYETEDDNNNLINNDNIKNEEDNDKNRKDIDFNKVKSDKNDEYSKKYNYNFKKRGTLTKGIIEESNYLQENSFDYEE